MQKNTIKTLWVGSSLGLIEQLCLRSFLAHGHEVQLFHYEPVAKVPEGTVLRDAREILPESEIFRCRNGSLASFSDRFRYDMLLKEGGTWVDTDVICIKPFRFTDTFLVGKEESYKVNTAVLGASQGHELMAEMAALAKSPNALLPYDSGKEKRRKLKRKWLQGNRRENIKWGEAGPLALTKLMAYKQALDIAKPITYFYPIHPKCWDSIFDATYHDLDAFFPDSYAIHLWNEMIRQQTQIDKNGTHGPSSLIEQLKARYL